MAKVNILIVLTESTDIYLVCGINNHGAGLINDLKWQNLDQRRDYDLATLMYMYVCICMYILFAKV